MRNGQGIWPAVWMLPSRSKYGGWAAGGEIDIRMMRCNLKDTTVVSVEIYLIERNAKAG